MMGLGWQELLIILIIVLVIFGADKLPEIGSGLGKGIRSFKDESDRSASLEEGESRTSSTFTSPPHDARDRINRGVETDPRERDIRADDV